MSPNPDAPQTPPDPASTAPGRRRRPLWPWLVLLAVGGGAAYWFRFQNPSGAGEAGPAPAASGVMLAVWK